MAGTTTILVTDLATSTEMLTRAGDEAGTTAITAHLRLVRDAVERHGGRVAKTLGDGVMALFDSAYGSGRAAIALQQEVERAARQPRTRAGMRIGCNVGEVIDDTTGDGEDVFGAAVVLAHRTCAYAASGPDPRDRSRTHADRVPQRRRLRAARAGGAQGLRGTGRARTRCRGSRSPTPHRAASSSPTTPH